MKELIRSAWLWVSTGRTGGWGLPVELALPAVGNLAIKANALVFPIPGCIMDKSRRMTI